MLKNVTIDELIPGMYVNQVLEQTGQLRVRSSGVVKSPVSIGKLKEMGITLVEVDYARSQLPEAAIVSEQVPAPSPATQSNSDALNAASVLYEEAVSLQQSFITSLNKGAPNDLSQASDLSFSIIDAVFDNQDAMSCLTMIKNSDQYLLEHSINCSILMAMFAQHLGYDRDTIDEACMGALLMDVGMSQIPQELRHKNGKLSQADWDVVKSHVDIGVELVEQGEQISDLALSVISQHHEREDGSGYPNALKSDTISPLSKMAAIVDCYDAMISTRPHKDSITPALALKRLAKDPSLDSVLVKQFVQCVGVHPVGSLVKLKSGRLGIISKQNPDDLTSPVVMTFYSITGGHFSEIKRIDLLTVDDEIESGVRPDDFGINLPKFFKDVFISQVPG